MKYLLCIWIFISFPKIDCHHPFSIKTRKLKTNNIIYLGGGNSSDTIFWFLFIYLFFFNQIFFFFFLVSFSFTLSLPLLSLNIHEQGESRNFLCNNNLQNLMLNANYFGGLQFQIILLTQTMI